MIRAESELLRSADAEVLLSGARAEAVVLGDWASPLHLADLLREGRFGAFARELLLWQRGTHRPLANLLLSFVLKPLLGPRRYLRSPIASHVRFTRVGGDYVLMDLKSGVYLGLDPVASRIWQSLTEHGDPERAAEELCHEFAVEPEQALTDIRAWIEELRKKGIIVRGESATAG